jgi:hypothetical protein
MMEGLLTERVDDEDVWSGFDARDAFTKYCVDNDIDEKIRQRQEEEEEGDEPEAEEKPEPCWEANEDCVIRAALKEAEGAEESQEPVAEESSADTERLLSIARGISRKLRRGV